MTTASWPADTSREVRETTVGDILAEAAADAPEQVALVVATGDAAPLRRWTYRELLQEAQRAATALLGRFQPGERIAIWAPNSADWLFTQLGAALAGIAVVPVNPGLGATELSWILSRTRASGLFVGDQQWTPHGDLPALRRVQRLGDWAALGGAGAGRELPDVTPDDACRVQLTLGTTGFPKPVVLHHRGWTNNSRYVAAALGAQPGEAWLNPLPFFHVSGFGPTTLAAIQTRSTLVLCPFDADQILALVRSERIAILSVPPPMLSALLNHPGLAGADLAALRAVSCGGMPFSTQLADEVHAKLGADFTMAYGQVEACGMTHKIRSGEDVGGRTWTVGRPLPQVEVKIVDLEGGTAPFGTVGEICVRGYQVMTGYFDHPDLTAQKIDSAGWLHMGDLGSMDQDGYLRVLGRREEVILRDGEYIFPNEIEDALHQHPAVARAAVLAHPNGPGGEITAFVQLSGVVGAAELTEHCGSMLMSHKVPTRWLFPDDLPLTPLGKVRKYALSGAAAEAGAAPDGTSQPLISKVYG